MGWNFNIKFYKFVQSVHLRVYAKYNLIDFNSDKVIEFVVGYDHIAIFACSKMHALI